MNIKTAVESSAKDIYSHARKKKRPCFPSHSDELWMQSTLCTKICTAGSSKITRQVSSKMLHFLMHREKRKNCLKFSLCLPDQKVLYYLCCCCSVTKSDSFALHGLQPSRLHCPRNSPGKNTGVGCHFLLQGISWSRDQTWVFCIASRVCYWATGSLLCSHIFLNTQNSDC